MTAARIDEFVEAVSSAFADGSLVRLKLGGYHGSEPDLKSVEARRIVVKGEDKLSFTFHYKTRDIIKNLAVAEAVAQLRGWLSGAFRSGALATTAYDLTFERNGDKIRLKRLETQREAADASHDRTKNRPVAAGTKAWQVGLGLTDAQGNVRKDAQDKFRQINRMVEIFAPLIQALPDNSRIIDMGAGKGYLDFALADWLQAQGRAAEIVGVELRPQLVEDGNRLAQSSGLASLSFAPGSILDYDAGGADAVIALHACDTATDDAIYKGITAGARLIAVAPCCHKQVRREMERGTAVGTLSPLLRHGVFRERQAEMLTDTLRALLLERHGYKTRVFEFVSDAHTPKNNLIVAEKDSRAGKEADAQIADLKAMFGIGEHYLERLLVGTEANSAPS